ncbi:sigma 54-interacting transcriptional regulator [Proteiniborus sp. MB09-C3]|uniref:sigma-54 interaction domain-containing protein n=1 Tax=Proteiniborus sp. MB09-C3 TaxID=3050072 RepID=UPI0025522BE9|nr:sigma 54-interacting transcriptional regulator [Proteiniborus sp. MB09-C3]WIV10415.1 sigma 54-interacting transcriptional regulator [Proteiniborus sp. MB09-C3]
MKDLTDGALDIEREFTDITLQQFKEIVKNSYDGIFVTDRNGDIVFTNPAAALYLDRSPNYILGKNITELLDEGIYNKSVILEAIQKKRQVTGIVNIASGGTVMSTCTPIFDANNELILTVTNVRVDSLLDTYINALEAERKKVSKYKSIVNYLGEVENANKKPIAESAEMKNIIKYADRISKTDTSILLLGESGTGKDVFARYIHNISYRSNEPYIPVNCAAIPQNLMESEFFGYEKGAFSGAINTGKPGYFELADKGTLFLDEIGDMSLSLQSKLLRVLETGEVLRLGGTKPIKTNVRIIAATNKDLYKMVNNNEFRGDLYYRLNIIPLRLPPLRERKEDIIALSNYFLEIYNKKYGADKKLTQDTIDKFINYSWPGNIRELKNVVERISIVSEDEKLELFDVGTNRSIKTAINDNEEKEQFVKQKIGVDIDGAVIKSENLKDFMDKVEKDYIYRIIEKCDGKISDAADVLGIHKTMLYRKIKKYK